ncbi:hypothetical protein TWF970_004720 [Orbilia oligospora]|uniref:Uracil-DNA glycosylase-like domain-containing protein n=1 Tax=Orbilia oligospora TaxID=2813651 RepID=A0A7C8RA26_ORBOL|nr:hypothetical protein TWF970_004720 [Orbilia oligospora]
MASNRVLRSTSSRSEISTTGNAVVEEKSTSFKGTINKFSMSTSESVASGTTEESKESKETTRTSTKRKYTDVLSYKAGAAPGGPKKKSSSYAPPSKYAHLKGVPDQLGENMYCMLIGLNPGIATSQAGHCYANPSNLFWRMLHQGGLTTRQFGRPTASQAELSLEEMDEGVADLERKCRRYRPESVCLIGKAIWESVFRAKHGRKMTKTEFKFGWQHEKENMGVDKKNGYPGARVYVVVSTSGLAAGYSLDYKLQLWKELGSWINERRAERLEESASEGKDENVKKLKVEHVTEDLEPAASAADDLEASGSSSIKAE